MIPGRPVSSIENTEYNSCYQLPNELSLCLFLLLSFGLQPLAFRKSSSLNELTENWTWPQHWPYIKNKVTNKVPSLAGLEITGKKLPFHRKCYKIYTSLPQFQPFWPTNFGFLAWIEAKRIPFRRKLQLLPFRHNFYLSRNGGKAVISSPARVVLLGLQNVQSRYMIVWVQPHLHMTVGCLLFWLENYIFLNISCRREGLLFTMQRLMVSWNVSSS